MTDLPARALRVGAWLVDPRRGEITRDGSHVRLEARSMRLLMHLATHAGEVVGIDDLLEHVWTGVIVTPDSVYQAVTSLRRALGDDARSPTYIATVPRLGYRMIATVEPWEDTHAQRATRPARHAGRRRRIGALAAILLIVLGAAGAWGWHSHVAAQAATAAPLSLAVLPFLDLTTQAMDEEYVADGMTEEIIDRLSTLPGVRVPGATASFYYKDKSLPVADIARALGVDYVLDGSVRKSGDTVRIATRLLHARDGYVVWTRSFDRPRGSVLSMQKDVAEEITRSLSTALALPSAIPNDSH